MCFQVQIRETGLEMIIRAIDHHTDHEDILQSACRCLANLTASLQTTLDSWLDISKSLFKQDECGDKINSDCSSFRSGNHFTFVIYKNVYELFLCPRSTRVGVYRDPHVCLSVRSSHFWFPDDN